LVENTGSQPIDIDEYCHNFVSIDSLTLGPEYHISMTGITNQDHKRDLSGGLIYGTGKGFSFSGYSEKPSMIVIPGEEINSIEPYSWRITNDVSKASVMEEVSFTPSAVGIWYINHIISPEVHYRTDINPGEIRKWTRIWTFDD
jgi:hypothetical protein